MILSNWEIISQNKSVYLSKCYYNNLTKIVMQNNELIEHFNVYEEVRRKILHTYY